MAQVKRIRRKVDGIILLDKPHGFTSNAALQKVRWLLNAEKAGHTGSLDPLATGVLPLCFGEATKFSQYLLDADKGYETVAQLGVTTTTGDAEGDVIERRPVTVGRAEIEALLPRFRGEIKQIPPMYSALKKDGQPLYKLARAGEVVEREARSVTIARLELLGLEGEQARLSVDCSKGTYIRTLGEDIGQALGCGAHLSALRRVRTGDFDVAQCTTLEALEALPEAQRVQALQPVEVLLGQSPHITLPSEEAGRFLSGLRRRGTWPDAAQVAVYGEAPRALLGSAHVRAGELIPTRLLSPVEVQQILECSPA